MHPEKQSFIHQSACVNDVNELTKHFPNTILETSSAYSTASDFINKNKVTESSIIAANKSPVTASEKVSSCANAYSIEPSAIYSNNFSTPGKLLQSKNHYENGKDIRALFKGDVLLNNVFLCSPKQDKPFAITYKSPSSDFVCSKCGDGFPCTSFLCKRITSPKNVKTEFKSINFNSLQNKDFISSIISSNSDYHNNRVTDSSENCFSLENSEIRDSSSYRNDEKQMKILPFKEENKYSVDEELLTEDKIQCVNIFNESNDASDVEVVKNNKNASPFCDINGEFNEHISQSPIACKDFNDVFSLSNLEMASPFRNFSLASNNRQTYNKTRSSGEVCTLSEETKKFLSELEASSTVSNIANVSNCTVIPSNSQELNSKMCNEDVSVSESNDKEIAISNDNKDCNISDVKDVTSALDFIEQSSLYDRNLSSAEICNSLNQIFSENTVPNVPSTEATNVESMQTEETANLSVTPVSVCVNNDSGILLQGVDSNVNFSADSETYINLSDLCSGSNTDNVQSILLIQDHTGNVESMFLIQDSANNGESFIVTDNSQIESAGSNQYITANIENIVVDTSENVQNLFITQDANNGSILINPNSLNQSGIVTENSSTETTALNSEDKNLDQKHIVTEKLTDEGKNISMEHTSDNVICINVCDDTSKEEFDKVSAQNTHKEENVSEDSSDKVENILLTLSNHTKKSIGSTLNGDNIVTDQNKNQDSVDNKTNNPQISESILRNDFQHSSNKVISKVPECNAFDNFRNFSKAKKSSPRSGISNVERAVKSFSLRHNAVQENSILSEDDCEIIQYNSSLDKITPVNGAVFHYESMHTESKISDSNSSSVNSERLTDTQIFRHKSPAKSKKSFHYQVKRSARKTSLGSAEQIYVNYSVPLSHASKSYSMHKDSIVTGQDYIQLKNIEILKKRRKADDDIDNHKRTKNNHVNNVLNNTMSNSNSILEAKSRFVALKTFKKPFTAARKSVLDSRDVTSFRNKALKTFVPKANMMKRALKSLARKQFRVQHNENTSSGKYKLFYFTLIVF